MKAIIWGIHILAFVSGLLICLSAWCSRQTTDSPLFTIEEYPRVDGSVSTQPLSVLIACRLTHTGFVVGEMLQEHMVRTIYPVTKAHLPYQPEKEFSLRVRESKFINVPSYVERNLWDKIAHANTHPSYKNLIHRQVELIIVAREPSDDELTLAEEQGIEIKTLPIARDALAFIVNSLNPVESISIDQIRAIYSGRLTNWAELGGANQFIKPFRRNRNSGSEEKMQKLVMRGLSPIPAKIFDRPRLFSEEWERTLHCMFCPFNALKDHPNGIAFTPYYYETYMAHTPHVKIIAVNNVMPSRDTIEDGSYPLVTEVVVAYLGDLPENSPAARLRDWLVTTEGQKVVAESGYVPIKK